MEISGEGWCLEIKIKGISITSLLADGLNARPMRSSLRACTELNGGYGEPWPSETGRSEKVIFSRCI